MTGFQFIVVALFYLPGLSNGEFFWALQDQTFVHIYFDSLEACEQFRDLRADDIGGYLTARQFDFWGDALKIKRDEVRLDYRFGCFEGQS